MPTTMNLTSERIRALFNSARDLPKTVGRHLDEREVAEYASGVIEPDRSASAERHLATCASCASAVEGLVLRLQPGPAVDVNSSQLAPLPGVAEPTIRLRQAAVDVRETHARVEALLNELGCVERDGDYALPNGLHADAHINVARLCSSEEALLEIAKAFMRVFRDVPFDAILAHGWTMGMIARRMDALLREQGRSPVQLAETEGYNPPTLVSGFTASSRVLVLTDVFVTGGLIEDLRLLLERRHSRAVGFGVVAAYRPGSERFGRIRPLCTPKFSVQPAAECSRCGILPLLEFNPVSCCMTKRRSEPRSPTEFLLDYPGATEFWEVVQRAKACEHHRVERRTHHLAFVDVARVLSDACGSAGIVDGLSRALLRAQPDLLVVPRRKRARLLADRLVARCKEVGGSDLESVAAVQAPTGWHVDSRDARRLAGKNVFIVDSAVGRGATLDNLFLLCRRHGAGTIGMVTLVSRLSEAHESALDALMCGRFLSAHRFPMRPLAVYRTPEVCPVCARRSELTEDASSSQAGPLRRLAARLTRRGSARAATLPAPAPTQLALPSLGDRPLLERCAPSVAAAITLNALHSSRNNGMAPLRLPEASDARIPAKNRAAMIACLPSGVSRWGGAALLRDIEACFAGEEVDAVWAAAASVLATELGEQWVRLFQESLRRAPHLWSTGSDATWDSIAYSVFQVAKKHYGLRQNLHLYVQGVARSLGNGAPQSVAKLAEVTSAENLGEPDVFA
ncbi:MAG: hypothetical protein AB7U83_12600 [Vicinamibacterales bacterium]